MMINSTRKIDMMPLTANANGETCENCDENVIMPGDSFVMIYVGTRWVDVCLSCGECPECDDDEEIPCGAHDATHIIGWEE